jgi:dephospho-CoA kinase
MPTVAVIGGIGSGKTAVTDLLAARGAVVVDADVVARDVVAPGAAPLGLLQAAFGDSIIAADGTLDRAALAAVAFEGPEATARLNAILHPAIAVEMARRVGEAREHAGVVVVAIPLFRMEHRGSLDVDAVICVDCPEEVALDRLMTQRGFTRRDAERRMGAQISREERVALADIVIDNSGSPADLEAEVDALWRRLEAT